MRNAILKGVFLTMSFAALAQSAPLRNVPVAITQPNGLVIRCYASGDEFFNWLHDANGYTIVQDLNTGFYTYAIPSDGRAVASSFVVGIADPAASGLIAHVIPARSPALERLPASAGGSPLNPGSIKNAPRKGTLNNLAVFIRFSDETEFSRASSSYDTMFNATAPGTNSMSNYFSEVSYNQLAISTSLYPVPSGGLVASYQDAHPRAYYQPYSVSNPIGYTEGDDGDERMQREHTLLVNAVNSISSQVPADLVIDGDGDGRVDNICFIVKGGPTGWSSLLWPHMWSLYSRDVYINSKLVFTYNFQLETALDSSGVGVLCHEMFHSLGAPDLYHYVDQGIIQPLYKWDLMDYNLNPPEHMTAYMKKQYGTWIADIPTITVSGTYTLNPVTSSSNNSYRINSPNSGTEYFIVEYRKRSGTFESSLPGEGLIVYRIFTLHSGHGNADGPPDEVYLFRPDGTLSANGDPSRANFNSTVGRTSFNDSTNPAAFLSDGSASGINISNVGAAGSTISFTVTIATSTVPAPVLNHEPDITFGTANTISWKAGGAASSAAAGALKPGAATKDFSPNFVPYSASGGVASAVAGVYARRTAAAHTISPMGPGGPEIDAGPPGVWQGVFSESFEGAFPGAKWILYGNPTWGKTSFAAYGGTSSAWCAASSRSPSFGYPDNMDAWMVYGPFSLADAVNAQVNFRYKNSSETGYDFFQWFVSTDNVNFYGYEISGDQPAWTPVTFDLTSVYGLGNLAGRSQVWIAFRFESDDTVSGMPGAFVDDVVIQKDVVSGQPDLMPYQPTGWNNKIPIGTTQLNFATVHNEDGPFYDNQILYFNWASINQGAGPANGYRVHVEVTGTGGGAWDWDCPGSEVGSYCCLLDDQRIGRLSVGSHAIKLWVDHLGAVAESNEGNNYYERTIDVLANPSEFYAECADNPNFTSPRNSGWTSSNQYTFTNLTPGVTYWYRVKARQSGVESAWSNVEYSRQTSVAVTSLTPSPSVPQPIGTPITWTAVATGGTAPLEYKFWVYSSSSGVWTMARDYSSANTYVWTPAQAGRYQVAVWVRSSGQTYDYDAFLFSGYFDITAPILPSVTLSPNPALPQAAGTPITWTAAGTGGTEPFQYKFWVYSSADAKWTMMQDYSTTNTFTWTPAQAGQYRVGVWLRLAGSAADYDAYKFSGYFDITPPPPPTVSLSANPAPPQIVGTPITWTAAGTGGPGPLQYKFWVYSSAESKWTMVQDYSTTNTYSWTPAQAGQYQVGVWLRVAGSAASYDAFKFSGYFDITLPPPPSVNLSASPAPPQIVGTRITWTATGAGVAGPLEYRFYVYSGAEAKWTMVQDYSTTNTYSWTPTQVGRYQIGVWLRGSGSAAPYDAYRFSGLFDITIPPTVTLSASPAPPQIAGTRITWTATGTGGSAPLRYRFYVYSGADAKWTMMQDYSTANTYSWTPAQAGQYQVAVWVRSSGSAADYDAYRFSGSFAIWSTTATLSSDAPAQINYGATMHFHVTASAPVAPLALEYGPAGMTVSANGEVTWIAKLPMFESNLDVNWCVYVPAFPNIRLTGTVRVTDPNRAHVMRRVGFEFPPSNSGFQVTDLNGDGSEEMLVGRGSAVYELGWNGREYVQRWVYPFAPENAGQITAVAAGDVHGDGKEEIFFAAGEILVMLDGVTRREIGSYDGQMIFGISEVRVADIEPDGALEVVCLARTSSSNAIIVLDALTLNEKWRAPEQSLSSSLDVGNVDADTSLEIVTGGGYVYDGYTRLNEWAYGPGFGTIVDTGDLDGDGIEEIIGLQSHSAIRGYDAILKSPIWEQTGPGLNSIFVTDFDGDGTAEILTLDGPNGYVEAYNYVGVTNTLAQIFRISSQDIGAACIGVGDLDSDGKIEFVWGFRTEVPGGKNFVVAGLNPGITIEWVNSDPSHFEDPFYGALWTKLGVGASRLMFSIPTTYSGYRGLRLAAMDPSTGDYSVSEELGSNWEHSTAADVVDYDFDGVDEVFLATANLYDGYFTVYDFARQIAEWTSPSDIGIGVSMVHADMNGDTFQDMIALTAEGNVYVYDVKNQVLMWKGTGLGSGCDVAVADLDGDGIQEILALGGSRLVKFHKIAGAIGYEETASYAFERATDMVVARLNGILGIYISAYHSGSFGATIVHLDSDLTPVGICYTRKSIDNMHFEDLGPSSRNLVVAIPGQGWNKTSKLMAIDPSTGAEIWHSPVVWGQVSRNSLHYFDPAGNGTKQMAFGAQGMYVTR